MLVCPSLNSQNQLTGLTDWSVKLISVSTFLSISFLSSVKEAELVRQNLIYTEFAGSPLIITEYSLNDKRLRVDNLNSSMTEKNIIDLFSQYGNVVTIQLAQGEEYGFIEMSTIKEAELAWQNLNHSEFSGQKLKVSVPTITSKNEVLRWD